MDAHTKEGKKKEILFTRGKGKGGKGNSPGAIGNRLISSALCLFSHSIAAHPPIPIQIYRTIPVAGCCEQIGTLVAEQE